MAADLNVILTPIAAPVRHVSITNALILVLALSVESMPSARYNNILQYVAVWMDLRETLSVNVLLLVCCAMCRVTLVYPHHVVLQMFVLFTLTVWPYAIHASVPTRNTTHVADLSVFLTPTAHSIRHV